MPLYGMAEVTANDLAFLKVSKELYLARNDHTAVRMAYQIYSHMSPGMRESLKNRESELTNSDEWTGFNKHLQLIGDYEKMQEISAALTEKITRLEKLCEAYMQGKDIIQERLAGD